MGLGLVPYRRCVIVTPLLRSISAPHLVSRTTARHFTMTSEWTSDRSPQHPKRLVFAPGDLSGPDEADHNGSNVKSAAAHLTEDVARSNTSTPTSVMQQELVSHPARAHQFVLNPPLTIAHLHPTNPLHQFHRWFQDPRIPRSSAPETCTLATASLPSGRVSARMLYFKELDERGWVIYSNWGSKEGKGQQIFGSGFAVSADGQTPGDIHETAALNEGNRWAALTFHWSIVERQVRIEGLIEPLSREESELYWDTRERGSQIGAWASCQSKVMWSSNLDALPPSEQLEHPDFDDGRGELEQRVKDMERRFADMKEIPLPPFWGGIRIVPESVEFWQGRASRLHDRFRYIRRQDGGDTANKFKWRIERLSP